MKHLFVTLFIVFSLYSLALHTCISFAQKHDIQGITYQIYKGDAIVVSPDEYKKRIHLYSGRVYVPDSVQIEGELYCVKDVTQAFMGCCYLKEIRLPLGQTDICGLAFAWCKSLQNFEIPNGVSRIYGKAFLNCKSLQYVKLPASLQRLGESAFEGCVNLKSIEIPPQVITIEDGAFAGCTRLKCRVLPQSVDTIGYFAFGGCKGLEEIYVHAVKPPVLDGDISSLPVFDKVKKSIPVHIPKGSKPLYMQAKEWSLFTNYIDDL